MSSTTATRDPNFVPGGGVGNFEQIDLTVAHPLTVAILDGSGNQITSFGGGTQYADGAARGTATGTLAMGDDGTNIQSVHVDSSGDLQVDVLTMPTVAVTGTFWQATQPVSGTFWQTTQPISVASLPLPTGASTLVEQQAQTTALGTLLTSTNFAAAFGTAGTADAQVMSVQGIASMTPVQVSQATAGNLNMTEASGAAIKTSVELIDNAISGAGFNITQFGGAAVPIGAGTEAAAVRVTLPTNGTGILAGVTTITTLSTLTGSAIAHDGADSGNPHKIGYKAFSPDGTTPGTAVAENDRTDAKSDLNGRLFVNTRSPQQLYKHLDGSGAYTDESVAADPGDGFQIVITSIIVSTGAATAMNFFLEEGSTKIFGPIYLEAVAGRGFVSGPIYLPVTASTAVTITTSAAIAQSINIDYFIQAV